MTSSTDWDKVVTVLENLGKDTVDSEHVSRESLPQILNEAVGLKEDYVGGYMLRRSENSPLEVLLIYGPKSRRFGLVLGNPTLIPSYLKRLQIVAVNPRLALYVGVD
jgi:hypothetical protein